MEIERKKIETPWGIAYVIAANIGGGWLVSLPKANMTVTHPSYRGGPCVNFIWK